MVATAAAIDDGPSAVRYPRGEGVGVELPAEGRAARDRQGADRARGHHRGAALARARGSAECLKAADQLAAFGLSTTVADARFAKPLDHDLIRRLAHNHEVLVTVEEGAVGGFGSHVLQYLAGDGLLDRGLKVRPLVLPDVFIEHDKPEKMYEKAGLNAGQIVATVLAALGRECRYVPRSAPEQPDADAIHRYCVSTGLNADATGRAAARPMQETSLDQLSELPTVSPIRQQEKGPGGYPPGLLFVGGLNAPLTRAG